MIPLLAGIIIAKGKFWSPARQTAAELSNFTELDRTIV